MQNSSKRVVITGMGLVSCLGSDVNEFFDNLVMGRSGIRLHPDIPTHPVGWVDFKAEEHFKKLDLLSLDRVSQFSLVASKQAVAMAGLDLGRTDRYGVLFGTGMGGASTLESSYANYFGIKPFARALTIPMAMIHAPASQISIHFGIHGECQTYSAACSSSSVAIGEAFRRIRDGYLDVAIAGGAECMLVPSVIGEWAKLRVLAPADGAPSEGCRPFSKAPKGFHLAEGAAAIVMEEREQALKRGARIYGEVVGYGVSNDGMHITKPSAKGQTLAIRRALDEAKIGPDDIGYINAHGTATLAGDQAEVESIRTVFGNCAAKVPVSATKSSHGHAIGATGAIEFIVTMLTLQKGIIPPTAFTSEAAPACAMDLVVSKARKVGKISFGMSNTFAFGGNNAVLIVKNAEEALS